MNQKNKKKTMLSKLDDMKGASLSETLITVLLLSIVLVAVVSGIAAASNSYQKIVRKAEAMTLLSTISISMEADLASATNTPLNKPVTVTDSDGSSITKEVVLFKSGLRGYNMYFDTRDDEICVIAVKDGIDKVTIPVATKAAHANYLRSELLMQPWDVNKGYFEYEISIYYNDQMIASQDYVTRPYK